MEEKLKIQKKLLHPKALQKKDKIGIISLGRWMDETQLELSSKRLISLGYKVYIHRQNYLRQNQFAGTDIERAKALEDMFVDPEIKAIMFAKGGYGTLRILDLLNFEKIKNFPKIVIGYSDVTPLLLSLYSKLNWGTFHGPMLYDLRKSIDTKTWDWFEKVLVKGEKIKITSDEFQDLEVVRSGKSVGKLIGGNLALLSNLVGTTTDFDTNESILFLEDIDEKLYSIDRMFLHLKRSGKLEKIKGLIIGKMTDITDDLVSFGQTINEIALYHTSRQNFPIVANFPFGHYKKQLVMPIGISCRLFASSDGDVEFSHLESSVAI